MHVLVILAHPDPASFNHAIAATVTAALKRDGHSVTFHDLHAENFPPSLYADEIPRDAKLPPRIAQHCDDLAAADGLVMVHPNWWGMPPAILKGWIDRVVRPGVAYEFLEGDGGEGVPHGLLKAQSAVVFNTGNTKMERELAVFGDPLETIWRNCIFGLCGVHDFHRMLFETIVTSSREQREQWLTQAERLVSEVFGDRREPTDEDKERHYQHFHQEAVEDGSP